MSEGATGSGPVVDQAIAALRDGKFILLYDFDDRERETDFIIRSDAVTSRHVMWMRKDGGGLICTAIHPEAARVLGLPFARDLMSTYAAVEQLGDIPYDRKNTSSFSLWVNHRDTFTGITDRDRALTITAIAEQVQHAMNGGGTRFHRIFRTPGHVAILRAADDLLDQRCGQTELSIALADFAGITPAVTVCEMLDDTTGLALGKEDALRYAREHGLVFLEGSQVMERWRETRDSRDRKRS
ncbi:MAG: 3,4-dihydroxy-2-butanone-4-phosphate synthase [Methanomicrobiales archaeon]|nr:3,4-dihydroxy-2-butanone-4-phosphate synthase [Methanomicrobiales archaeon]